MTLKRFREIAFYRTLKGDFNMQETNFEIDRDAVKNYFLITQTLLCLLLITFFGIGLILALIHYFLFGPWLCPQQANNLRYRLEGSTLRADGGVFFLFRKSIPLERITAVALFQYLGNADSNCRFGTMRSHAVRRAQSRRDTRIDSCETETSVWRKNGRCMIR